MSNLKQTSKIVKSILTDDKRTRNSDSFLYLKVLDYIADKNDIFLAAMPVPYFLENLSSLPFPSYETVSRCRRKIQEHHPELAAEERVAAFRAENEQDFRAYARGEVE